MYEQKMCYIDLYRNGVKCGNMGHVRMEWDGERYRFGASLCHMDRQTLVTAVLERTGGRPRTTIQNIAIIHGRGSAQFDWMPLEGNEESLLFQASGEVYGICRLPKMREVSKQENAETPEQAIPPLAVISAEPEEVSEVASHPENGRRGMSGVAVQNSEGNNDVSGGAAQNPEGRNAASRGAAQNPEGSNDVPGAASGTAAGQSDMLGTVSKPAGKADGMPAAGSRAAENVSGKSKTVSQMSDSQNRRPETRKTTEKEGGMLEAVLRTMEKQNEEKNAVPEAAPRPALEQSDMPKTGSRAKEKASGIPNAVSGGGEQGTEREKERQGTVRETIVLSYPQGAEERRRRERHVTALSDDKWKQLCSIYPIVHPIGDDVEFIRITPADFVVLRQEYQNLVRNSFLLHGYYNYEHILLGKYPDKYYIGVPGIMHEQERIAAAMFGFVGFERAKAPKEQKENRDQFGYYMMEVGI